MDWRKGTPLSESDLLTFDSYGYRNLRPSRSKMRGVELRKRWLLRRLLMAAGRRDVAALLINS